MEIKKVGNKGILFTFYDLNMPTNVYVINGKSYFYVIDTYLGPDIMDKVSQYMKTHYGDKQAVVVNTHNHWDHVWGNCFFPSSIIISHKLCKKNMEKYGDEALLEYKDLKRGDVTLTYPNLTFTDEIWFEEDNLYIYYTPGHTNDGISIVDFEDKVLLAGDNLERPIPYIASKNLKQYIKTLEDYLKLDVDFIIGGHTACEDKRLVEDNLDYIKKVSVGDCTEFEKGEYAANHKCNMEFLKSIE